MNNVLGYDNELKNILDKFISNNLPNSIIFHGSKGLGKRLFVNNLIIELIKLKIEGSKINHHINLFYNNSHPNIKIVEKEIDEKSNKIKSKISIEQIRNLKNFIYKSTSFNDLFKIVIVDSADDFNLNSSNSFLKTLEEPKGNTFIFLISHQLSSLIPTIRSRCLKIKMHNHNYKNFSNIINSYFKKINDEKISFLFDLSNGSPGLAINLFDENIFKLYNNSFSLLSNNNEVISISEITDEILKLDNDKFKNYISLLKSILIDLSKFKLSKNKSKIHNNFDFNPENVKLKKIFEKLDFLSNNENDLFTFNFDKKLFMMNFFTI